MKPSNEIIIESPMSYRGSAKRIMTGHSAVAQTWLAIVVWGAWCVVSLWYFTFGLLLVPYRLIRRSQRKSDLSTAQHAEVLDALRNTQNAESVR